MARRLSAHAETGRTGGPVADVTATQPPIEHPEGLRDALAELEDWKSGRRSWTNLGPAAPYTPDVIAVMDAQEVVKLSAYVQALRSTGNRDETGPWIGPNGEGRPSMADDLAAVASKGPREVLTAALLRGPGRYSRSGSQALAERLLLALEDAGYVIGEARA